MIKGRRSAAVLLRDSLRTRQCVKFILRLFLIASMLLTVASCGGGSLPQSGNPAQTSPDPSAGQGGGRADAPYDMPEVNIDMDRSGNPITLPDNIERVISMGPSITEILVSLGFTDKIIATDNFSGNIQAIDPDAAILSMMEPDSERIISMAPDIIFVTEMSIAGAEDPLAVVADLGVCIVFIPSSTSIAGIIEDIRFIAAVMGTWEKGEEIVADMETEIDRIREIGKTITDKKRVYFEIEAAPFMYSFGHGTFLHEMIEILGAENIFGDVVSWTPVAGEAVLDADPDVILTSVNYIDDPVGEIMSRSGWGGVTAIRNNAVHYIDTDSSNRPSHNIVIALLEMAGAVYPEKF